MSLPLIPMLECSAALCNAALSFHSMDLYTPFKSWGIFFPKNINRRLYVLQDERSSSYVIEVSYKKWISLLQGLPDPLIIWQKKKKGKTGKLIHNSLSIGRSAGNVTSSATSALCLGVVRNTSENSRACSCLWACSHPWQILKRPKQGG